MTSEIMNIVDAYRNAGHIVSDDECKEVYKLCLRKMELGKIHGADSYVEILFADELKNYLFRRFVNKLSADVMLAFSNELAIGKEAWNV